MAKREEIAKKGKGFIAEFKAFILRGNVMDMAIGVIIGGAFQGIEVIKYGDFITAVINFIIMAFILFLLLKFVNKVLAVGKKEEKKEPIKTDEAILLEEIRDLLKKSKK